MAPRRRRPSDVLCHECRFTQPSISSSAAQEAEDDDSRGWRQGVAAVAVEADARHGRLVLGIGSCRCSGQPAQGVPIRNLHVNQQPFAWNYPRVQWIDPPLTTVAVKQGFVNAAATTATTSQLPPPPTPPPKRAGLPGSQQKSYFPAISGGNQCSMLNAAVLRARQYPWTCCAAQHAAQHARSAQIRPARASPRAHALHLQIIITPYILHVGPKQGPERKDTRLGAVYNTAADTASQSLAAAFSVQARVFISWSTACSTIDYSSCWWLQLTAAAPDPRARSLNAVLRPVGSNSHTNELSRGDWPAASPLTARATCVAGRGGASLALARAVSHR